MPPVALAVTAPPARPVIWRITDRTTFQRLRADGRRRRRGPLSVVSAPTTPVGAPARVAFTVSRTAGGAVARNRIRRRLRAATRELARAGSLPEGAYLIGASAEVAEMSWPDLVATLTELVDEVAR